jgi:hypothetical protein
MDELTDDELLDELGVKAEEKKISRHTPREERIIAGFEDIARFYDEHGRLPLHGEDRDIFERLYAVRLDRLREQPDCRTLLAEFDTHGLLAMETSSPINEAVNLDDDALLEALGIEAPVDDITQLKHVKSREAVRVAEEIANRTVCADFDKFEPLFAQVKKELAAGIRETRRLREPNVEVKMAEIRKEEFFIIGGQTAYVADVGEEFTSENGRRDSRLRVIFDNRTESDVLLRSLQRAMHRDDASRSITNPVAGPLFGNDAEGDDLESGTIYVLRSQSNHPDIAAHRELIHKIGVTGGSVEARIANAADDATFLLAGVEVIATYKLYNINRSRLENLLHRVFAAARLDLAIEDRFGKPVRPKEWFLVPLSVIDDVVAKIKDQSITEFVYDPLTASLKKISEKNEPATTKTKTA